MFECKIVRKKSKKGTYYTCMVVTFPNGYEKIVFLDKAEEYMAEQYITE